MYCSSPKIITNPYSKERLFVPCGKCQSCLIHHQNIVSQRIKNECDKHKFNIFFTLTYDNENIPYIKLHDNNIYRGDVIIDSFDNVIEDCSPNIMTGSLSSSRPLYYDRFAVLYYKDVQNFLKNLRYEIECKFQPLQSEKPDYKLRYAICGEYGFNTFRPHMHGLFHTNNEKLASFLLDAICKVWTFCDWRKICLQSEDALPSYVNSDKGPDYVSKYTTKFDSKFLLSKHHSFRPFVRYSKIPYYGLSSFDEEVIEQIVSGAPLSLSKTIIKESCKPVVIKSSSYLQDFLFGKCPKYIKNITPRLVSFIVENEVFTERPLRNFIERIRKHVKWFFGAITYDHVFFFLQRLQTYWVKLKSDTLKDEMLSYDDSKKCDYVKLKYQTLSPFFLNRVESEVLKLTGSSILDMYHKIDGYCCKLVNIFVLLFEDFGISLTDLADLCLSPPSLFFKSEIQTSINRHKSYVNRKML